MWVTKLLIFPVEIRIFCPKTTKFGIFGQFGPGHAGLFNALLWVGLWLWRAGCISQDTYLLYKLQFACTSSEALFRLVSFSFIKPIPTFTYTSYFVSSLGIVVKCNHMINCLDFSFFWQNSSTMEREWGAIMCWMINKRCKTGYWWQLMMHLLRQ